MRQTLVVIVPAGLFVALCSMLVPYPGLQQDELLFAGPLYDVSTSRFAVNWFGREIPLMLLTYLGCLKTWLFAPILAWTPATVWSVRLPVILVAALTIALTVSLLVRIHGRRAAWIGGLLLATDPMFVLTSTFDWGPVVLQHVLGVAAISLAYSCYRTSRSSRLFLACLLAGLALWNKALFVWTLAGFIGACALWIVPIWRRFRPIRPARLFVAMVLGATIGASPLIGFGMTSGFYSIPSGSGLDASVVADKLRWLRSTLDGSGLFGYLASHADQGGSRQPVGGLETAAVRVADSVGPLYRNVIPWILGLSMAAIPWLARKARWAAGFLTVAGAIAWLVMAMTRGGGASPHHVVLLWPLPHLIIALVAADVSERSTSVVSRLVTAVIGVMVCVNLLIVNQYLSQMIRYGTPGPWTGATHRLIDRLRVREPGSRVLMSDWGIDVPVRAAFGGRLPIDWVGTPESVRNQDQDNYYRRILEAPGLVWATHTAREEISPGTNAAVEKLAHQLGFSVQLLETIEDAQGRPVYELRVFKPAVPR